MVALLLGTAILIGSPLRILTSGLLATKIAWGEKKSEMWAEVGLEFKGGDRESEPTWRNGGNSRGHAGRRGNKTRINCFEEAKDAGGKNRRVW